MKLVRITDEMGVPRLDFTYALNQARVYKPMDSIKKQEEIVKRETLIRETAWFENKLNPLIGTDTFSSEPIWDVGGNVL